MPPPSRQRLQQLAILISILSIVYNGIEGGLSIGFGADVSSKSLLFFGVQSFVEVLSAILVVYRFRHVAKPGDEANTQLSLEHLALERNATMGIGSLFIILAITTWSASFVALSRHQHPETAIPTLIISSSALGIMIAIWVPKVWLYKRLNSSTMKAEADCSLACIALTSVLLGGSIIYRFWKRGWWVDSVAALVLGSYFAKEGVEMVRWARHPSFNGGCCNSCTMPTRTSRERLDHRCGCCKEKQSCREAAQCKCAEVDYGDTPRCPCLSGQSDGLDCCQRELLSLQLVPSPSAGWNSGDQELETITRREDGGHCSDACCHQD